MNIVAHFLLFCTVLLVPFSTVNTLQAQKLGPISVQSVYTTDKDFNKKAVFAPGDRINYHADINNNTNSEILVDIKVKAFPNDYSPDPRLYNYQNPIPVVNFKLPPGLTRFYNPADLPSNVPAYFYAVRITVTPSGCQGTGCSNSGDWGESTFTVTLAGGPTAGRACMFYAPNPKIAFGLVGHVGWAFRNDTDDKWVFGATENLNGERNISPGVPASTQSWQAQGTWTQVLQAFREGHTGQDFTPGPGYYYSYRCININVSSPAKAKKQADVGQNSGYDVIIDNCLTKGVDILRAYGVIRLQLAHGKSPAVYYGKSLNVARFEKSQPIK